MPKTAQEWLEKATFTTADLRPPGGGYLSPQQAREFLRVAISYTTITKEARYEDSDSPLFEIPRISFGNRILRPGSEGARLGDPDRVKPETRLVTLSTVLVKGEVPITDEVLEDNIERARLADTIMEMLAEAVGRDLEELFIKGDTARTATEDQYLKLLDGLIKQAQAAAEAVKLDASTITTYDDLFGRIVESMPAQYRRSYPDLRLYVPVKHRDGYQRALAARGTGLGDQATVTNLATQLAFRGIPLREVPLMSGTSNVNGASVDYSKFALLTNPQNIVVGFHRRVRVERFRDPREGSMSIVVTARADVKLADPNGVVLAHSIAL
ncbi:MAG: phage major capsid protein [Chloroflexota bacterium]